MTSSYQKFSYGSTIYSTSRDDIKLSNQSEIIERQLEIK